jgi:hypothetical protein
VGCSRGDADGDADGDEAAGGLLLRTAWLAIDERMTDVAIASPTMNSNSARPIVVAHQRTPRLGGTSRGGRSRGARGPGAGGRGESWGPAAADRAGLAPQRVQNGWPGCISRPHLPQYSMAELATNSGDGQVRAHPQITITTHS